MVALKEQRVFRVYDLVKFKYWTTPKGKTIWTKPASAKNAWNCQEACRYGDPVFNDMNQARYEIHAFKLVRDFEN